MDVVESDVVMSLPLVNARLQQARGLKIAWSAVNRMFFSSSCARKSTAATANLLVLNLSFNGLRDLRGIFAAATGFLVNVQMLNVSYNCLQSIAGCENLPNLITLVIAHNKVSFIDSTTANSLRKLEYIDLQRNSVATLPSLAAL